MRRLAFLVVAVACIGATTVLWTPGPPSPLGVSVAAAAQPSASPAAAGDTRSAGAGPGLVGAPLLAILGVLAIGVITAALTIAYVRLTSDRRSGGGPPDQGSP